MPKSCTPCSLLLFWSAGQVQMDGSALGARSMKLLNLAMFHHATRETGCSFTLSYSSTLAGLEEWVLPSEAWESLWADYFQITKYSRCIYSREFHFYRLWFYFFLPSCCLQQLFMTLHNLSLSVLSPHLPFLCWGFLRNVTLPAFTFVPRKRSTRTFAWKQADICEEWHWLWIWNKSEEANQRAGGSSRAFSM